MAIIRNTFPGSNTPDASAQVNIPSRAPVLGSHSTSKIWAIGGGKGGIGKTILTSNMAVYLSWLNRKVVVLDLDLGGSNLHTSLGVPNPSRTLGELLNGTTENIKDLLLPTPVRGLQLISGANDSGAITSMRPIEKAKLLRKIQEIEADYILLDLGAGTSSSTLDFFLAADEKIVLVTPEPTSIENAYRFIKLAFYRMLRAHTTSPHVRHLIERAMEMRQSSSVRTPKELLDEVRNLSPMEGSALQETMRAFRLSLVVNQVRTRAESDIGRSILMVCERYFGMSVDYLGFLPYDSAVWQSIRKRVPFLVEAPNSVAVTHLESIMRNLLKTSLSKAG